MRSLLNVVASKSAGFETVVKLAHTLPAPPDCRLQHPPLCTSSCQHDQHVIQKCCEAIPHQTSMTWAPGQGWLLNRHILHMSSSPSKIPCSCCRGIACTLPLNFHSSLRSCKFLLCRLSLPLSFRSSSFGVFVLSHSTYSGQQRSAAFP